MRNWFEELMFADQRRAQRHSTPRLVAYYWDGATPQARPIRDVSSRGLYLVTEQRWYPGTLVTMTLQRTEKEHDGTKRSIAVQARVIRDGDDGVAFAFAFPQAADARRVQRMVADGTELADQRTLDQFLRPVWFNTSGQALVEYLLLLPLLFLFIVNAVNFGGFFYAWITVANAARAGANYAILGGASVGSLPPATGAQVDTLITQDIYSLPNKSSLVVNVCQNFNGTVKALAGTCSAIPADPEPSNYMLTSVDVTYTYKPFIPAGFQFPNLNLYATIPPTTVHRRAVMRTIM